MIFSGFVSCSDTILYNEIINCCNKCMLENVYVLYFKCPESYMLQILWSLREVSLQWESSINERDATPSLRTGTTEARDVYIYQQASSLV